MFKKLVEFVKGLFGCSEGQKKAEAAIALAKQKREEMMKQRPTTPPQPYRPTVNVEIVEMPKTAVIRKPDLKLELPVYAKDRVLPPKAKNKFRQEAIRRRRTETRNTAVSQSDSPHIDPVTTGVLGYNLGLMDDSSSSSRSSSSSSSSSSCSRSDSDYSYSSSSSSSYDSSSSDSGSSSSSCD